MEPNKRKLLGKLLIYALIVLQILDGSLTYWGVTKYGVWIEGNIFIHYLISQFGPLKALLGTKICSITLLFVWKLVLFQKETMFSLYVLSFLAIIYLLVVLDWLSVFILGI